MKKMKETYKNFALTLMAIITSTSFANQKNYFLCGTDEDGCNPSIPKSCLCIAKQPSSDENYCLKFTANNNFKCTANFSSCASGFQFNSQSACLADAYQSEPKPACIEVPDNFCQNYGIKEINDSSTRKNQSKKITHIQH